MRTIFKYPINITDCQTLMHKGSKVLLAGLDPGGTPCIWMEVDTETKNCTASVYIVGTGNPIPAEAINHIGSFIQGPFVWHVYLGV